MPLPCIRILDNGEFSRRQVIDCCWALPNNSPRLPTRRDEGIGSIRANNLCLFRCIKADDSSAASPSTGRPRRPLRRQLLRKRKQFVRAKLFLHGISVGCGGYRHVCASQPRKTTRTRCLMVGELCQNAVHPPALHLQRRRTRTHFTFRRHTVVVCCA